MITADSFASILDRQEKMNKNFIDGPGGTILEHVTAQSLRYSQSGVEALGDGSAPFARELYVPRVFLFGSTVSCTALHDGDTDYAVLFVKRDGKVERTSAVKHLTATKASVQNYLLLITRRSQIELLNKFYCLMVYSVALDKGYAGDTRPAEAARERTDGKDSTAIYQEFQGVSAHFQRIFCARVPLIQFFPSYEYRGANALTQESAEVEHPEVKVENIDISDDTALPHKVEPHVQPRPTPTSIEGPGMAIPRVVIKGAPSAQLDYKFDITFSPYGVLNSILLRYFVLAFPCLRPLLLIIKHWGKRQGIVNSRAGWLSSYALSIMLIEYLQTKGHVGFIDPYSSRLLKAVEGKVLHAPSQSTRCACLFCDIEKYIPFHEAEQSAEFSALLTGFFHYYAYEIDFEDHVIDITRGSTSSAEMAQASIANHACHPAVNGDCCRYIVSSPALALPNRHRKGVIETFFTPEEEKHIKAEFQFDASQSYQTIDGRSGDPKKGASPDPKDYMWHYLGYNLFQIKDPYESHSLGRSVEFFKAEAMKELFENFFQTCDSSSDVVKSILESEPMLSRTWLA
ncbi:RNA editing [Perkinsela sp. CCAP 1560/4]|nr:RNA editing [Perkinsela sp. CCAP 1560/4]|eukprot:KNH06292.1 RNA editing [Perkinsela sp. CCAP 1560/4]